MSKYKLSIDKYINTMDFIEIETDLCEQELDALLDKLEKVENVNTEDYIKKLQAQGIQINSITPGREPYYTKAEVNEVEKIEEPTIFEFLTELKSNVTEEEFKMILAATDADIKFNRVGFGKRTTPKQYINVCRACCNLFLRIEGR